MNYLVFTNPSVNYPWAVQGVSIDTNTNYVVIYEKKNLRDPYVITPFSFKEKFRLGIFFYSIVAEIKWAG